MPLSEEEQRLLEQMEQALSADDPGFASTLRGSKLRARNRRHAIGGGLGFVIGIALLMIGVIITMTPLGVAGFVIMLGSAYLFLTAWRSGLGEDEEVPSSPSGPQGHPAPSESFMQRMEGRWKRRRDSGL